MSACSLSIIIVASAFAIMLLPYQAICGTYQLPDYQRFLPSADIDTCKKALPEYAYVLKDNFNCDKNSWNHLTEGEMRWRSVSWFKELLESMKNGSFLSASNVNSQRLGKVFNKINRGENVTIFVFGGSLTYGANIYYPYYQVLQWAFEDRYKTLGITNASVTIVRKAVPATTSEWLLNHISIILRDINHRSVDLVTIDYDVNDCARFSDPIQHLAVTEALVRTIHEHDSSPAVVYVDISITHDKTGGLEPNCAYYHTCYAMGEIKRPVLNAYEVPIISQKMAVWSNFTCPPPAWEWGCKDRCAHCDEHGHKIISSLVYGFLTTESFDQDPLFTDFYHLNSTKYDNNPDVAVIYPESPLMTETQKLNEQRCARDFKTAIGNHVGLSSQLLVLHKNSSSLNSTTASTSNDETFYGFQAEKLVYEKDKCWQFYEDMPGKPGWIIDGVDCFDATIVFNVSFGPHPILNIEFLSTYDRKFGRIGICLAQTTVNGVPVAKADLGFQCIGTVDAFHGLDHPYSMPEAFIFQSHPNAARMNDFHHHEYILEQSMRPNTDYLLRLELLKPDMSQEGRDQPEADSSRHHSQGSKFKIESITTC